MQAVLNTRFTRPKKLVFKKPKDNTTLYHGSKPPFLLKNSLCSNGGMFHIHLSEASGAAAEWHEVADPVFCPGAETATVPRRRDGRWGAMKLEVS